MKRSEFLKYINKRVELTFKDDNRIYIGRIISDEHTKDMKRPCYTITNEESGVIYRFRPSHIKSIKELEDEL